MFWFYHCNLDRLWLSWQQYVGATTLAGFTSTLSTASADWLAAPFNILQPVHRRTTDETIEFGISYDRLELGSYVAATMENKVGSIDAARALSIKRSSPVSVRVKGIDRLNIPGSFVVNILADGNPDRTAVLLPARPTARMRNVHQACARQHRLPDRSRGDPRPGADGHHRRTRGRSRGRHEVPLARAGNPSVNARLLLEDA